MRRGSCLLTLLWLTMAVADGTSAGEGGPVRSLLEMRRERVIVQEWDLSCGAAALATILHFQHADFVSEREIAQALISREEYLDNPDIVRVRQGFSLLDLKRYVDGRGYQGVGYGKLDLDDLDGFAPVMLPVSLNGYNHFVVYRGRLGNRVLLADPAWGNRTMMVDDFEAAWLDYAQFGRVGFVIEDPDEPAARNRLAPRSSDFVLLR